MQVELMEGDADVRVELAALANEEEPTTEQVAGGPHTLGIDVADGNGAGAQEHGDLVGVDLVVLRLSAVDGLHVERMADDEGDVMLGAEVGEPVPAEDALDAADQVVPVGLDGPEEGVGLAAQIAVQDDLAAFMVEDAEVHGPSVEIDPAVVSMLASVEAHGSPPGMDEWVALSSCLPRCGRSRRGLHQDHTSCAYAACAAPEDTGAWQKWAAGGAVGDRWRCHGRML
jgi:hypothetical protein